MNYYLQPAFLTPPPPLEISKEEFFALKNARTILNAAFSLEENYDLLIGNYLELETTALTIATTSMIRKLSEYREMFELKAEINRRVVNLLTAARIFVDHFPQRYRECNGDLCIKDIKDLFGKEYDRCFEYRFMEALRNHVQHGGLAVHNLGLSSRWRPPGERIWDEHHLTVLTVRAHLVNTKFKNKVLAECPEKVDILASIRRYIESLGRIQDHVRKNISSIVLNSRKTMEDAINKYVSFSSSSPMGLEAKASLTGEDDDRVAIFLDWDDVRMKLISRNGSMANLGVRTVVSAPRDL